MAFGGYSKEMSQGDSLNTNVSFDSSPQINNNNVVAPVPTNMVNDTYLPLRIKIMNKIVDINNGVVY